jgi:hypothetical protein
MPRPPLASGGPLPRWLVAVGSAAIIFHLAAIIVPVLDVPSGPWFTRQGPQQADAPAFAHAATDLAKLHAEYLRVANSYYFVSNRPADFPAVQFEVRLRDKDGAELKTLPFPDPEANPWVRHRQELLAGALAFDVPVERPTGSDIIYPGGQIPEVQFWTVEGENLKPQSGQPPPPPPMDAKVLRKLSEKLSQNNVPRNREVMRPADLALILARSYARHLCRTHGAASAEIIRHVREPVPPASLYGQEAPTGAFDEFQASFGRMTP